MALADQEVAVTFHMTESDLINAGNNVYAGRVSLSAVVRDLDTWEGVLENIRSLQIFKHEDVRSAFIGTLRTKATELERDIHKIRSEAEDKVQRAEQQANLAKAAQVKAEQKIRLLEARLLELEGLEKQLQDLAGL